MKKINIRKYVYLLKREYFTLNNIVLAAGLFIAAAWMWGALSTMQRNYALQREVDSLARELQLVQLQRDSLELQGRYYQTEEYQELAVRHSLGLVQSGEKVLIIPESGTSSADDSAESALSTQQSASVTTTSNFQQWMDFLFGNRS